MNHSGRKKRKRIIDFRLVGLLFLVGLVGYLWWDQAAQEELVKRQSLLPVATVQPEFGNLENCYSINGYLETAETVTVIPKTGGTLDILSVDAGDYVLKGQILGSVDRRQLQLSLNQAATALAAAEDAFRRQEELYSVKATSQQNFEQAQSHYEAQVAQYELAALHYSYADLEAPISGTVLQIHSSEGSLVGGQTPILTIGTLDDLRLKARIPERYYTHFLDNPEMKVQLVRPDEPDTVYSMIVDSVSPVITPSSMSFEAECRFVSSSHSLRPGMFVQADFILSKMENIWFLPNEIIRDDQVWFVESEDSDDDTMYAYPLMLSTFFESNQYRQIPEEYKDYRFVCEGFYFLNDGQKVRNLSVDGAGL